MTENRGSISETDPDKLSAAASSGSRLSLTKAIDLKFRPGSNPDAAIEPVMTLEHPIDLRCHPSTPPGAVSTIQVLVRRSEIGALQMTFRLDGDISRISVSPPGVPCRARQLWRHTCFEAFIAVEGRPAYHEFNFAPSGEWAVYAFRDYRNGGPLSNKLMRPRIAVRFTSGRLELEALVRLDLLSAVHTRAPLNIGLSAVIEANNGLSYWALRHPVDRPDFHDAKGFALLLAPPGPNLWRSTVLMKHDQPRGLGRRTVEELLLKAKRDGFVGSRMDLFSRHFLGCRYKPNPLIGSADTAEVFTASLDGFDCVTYIETVLALARATTVDDFIEWLRKIRYECGRIQWERRNHYMTGWIRNNVREKIIRPVSTPAVSTISRERVLNVVPGLAALRTRVKCIPKRAEPRLSVYLQNGDLIFFVSTRKDLDVFHAGIIAHDNKRVLLRHASRSKGFVVEQELNEFLEANQMTGVIVVRPQGDSDRRIEP
jgi:N-acetylmuramoyl-L-alanine amidase-like